MRGKREGERRGRGGTWEARFRRSSRRRFASSCCFSRIARFSRAAWNSLCAAL